MIYVALGDSFTAGTGCEPGERWPDLLAERLRATRPSLAYRNLAVRGATSAAVLADQLEPALASSPDIVTLVCGANDVLDSVRPDIDAYAERLGSIIERLRAECPDVAIVTATCPELARFLDLRRRTRERVLRGIQELNEATLTVAGAHGVPCLEVTRHPGIDDPRNLGLDGFHPSPEGHRQAAVEFGRALREHFGIETEAHERNREGGSAMTALFSQDFDRLAGGERFSTPGRTITESDVVSFAALTGDWHPQHADAEWAAQSRFGRRVAHGMLVLSYAVGLVPLDPERVVALRRVADATFKRPTHIGDTIHVEGAVERAEPLDPEVGLVTCRWRIVNQHESLVARTRVEVLWRRGDGDRRVDGAEPELEVEGVFL